MEKIPKHLPEIQTERDNLAHKIKNLRREKQTKSKEAKTKTAKVRDFLNMEKGSDELKRQAEDLKRRIENELTLGKSGISRNEEDILVQQLFRQSWKLQYSLMLPSTDNETKNLIQYFVQNQDKYLIALNQDRNRAKIIASLGDVLSSIHEEDVLTRKIFTDFFLAHYPFLKKELEESSGDRPAAKTFNLENSIRVILKIFNYAQWEQQQTILEDLVTNIPRIQESVDGDITPSSEALLFILEQMSGRMSIQEQIWSFIETNLDGLTNKSLGMLSTILSKGQLHETKKRAHAIVQKYLKQKYNFSFTTERFWPTAEIEIFPNLRLMQSIEGKRPGIVKLLHEKFGIREFQRYPEKLLIRQYDEYDDLDKPYGIIIYPTEDHNNAFDHDHKTFSVLDDEIKDSYALRVFECTTRIDIGRTFISLDQKYGSHNKISFAILGGHGSIDSMTFGKAPDDHKGRGVLNKSMIKSPGIQKLNEYFTANPSIVLSSCSTGKKQGLAQTISEEFPNAHISAPNKPTTLTSIHAHIDQNGISLEAEYQEDDTVTKYKNGENLIS